MKPCPECGSDDRERESGQYALIKVSPGGTLDLHTEAPRTEAIVATALTCNACGHVALFTAD